jgi:hypothetical protein
VRDWLTPPAAAIAALALGLCSVTGASTIGMAAQSLVGTTFSEGQYTAIVVATGLCIMLIAAGGLLCSRHALAGVESLASWADALARASVVVCGLGALLGLITVLGGLLVA